MNAGGSSDTQAVAAASAETAESLTPGELLRRERERRSISLLHAAEDLHLDTRIVEAMEANRFDLLGVPVYARGHLRKYAALLGLSPQFIIERYEALTDRPAVPTPMPTSSIGVGSVGLERRSNKGPLWMAVTLIALGIGWWIFTVWTSSPPEEAPQPVQMEAPVDAPMSEPAAAVAPAVTSPTTTTVAAATTAPVVDDVRVRLEYSDPSWTEIYDAAGKRLMFGLGDAGRARTVLGTPPLRVTLGNASAVTVQVNDRSVVVPRQSGKDSARFLIAASGAVQMLSGEVPVE
jgi:cytoskeleton protein RodZ